MAQDIAGRRLAAILAADVVGFAHLMERDEAGTLAALRHYRKSVFDPAVAEHNGRIVKLMGDGSLLEFASVVDAVNCAVRLQKAAFRAKGGSEPPFVLRIGINLGDVIIEDEDIYGDGVNVAARLEPLAAPGGICIAGIVHEAIGNRVEAAFRDGGEIRIKNIGRPVRIWKWHPADPAQELPAAGESGPAPTGIDAGVFSSTLSEILTRISMDKGVPVAPLKAVLLRLGEEDVPPERIAERLAAKADEFLKLKEQLWQASNMRPDVVSVRRRAVALLEKGDLDQARTALADARHRLSELRREHSLAEASLIADEAGIDMLQLRYREAAAKYGGAAELARFDRESAVAYFQKQGDALYASGAEFGDNQALLEVIGLLERHLLSVSRADTPHEWAAGQASLGAALWKLGARESGSARLKEAVIACRQACQTYSKEADPGPWGVAQHVLGTALQDLGVRDRDDGVAYLEEAVAAYRSALEVRTPETAPREWTLTVTNLALSLQRLAERQGGTATLEEAIELYRRALTLRTRARVPLEWAATLSNMGMALHLLGERRGKVDLIRQAIGGYREALEVRRRQRVPLAWAGTQFNLGNALRSLAELTGDVDALQAAAAAYEDALKEWTRERLPLDWAAAYGREGLVLAALAAHTGDTRMMEGAFDRVCVAYQALQGSESTQLETFFEAELGRVRELRDNLLARTAETVVGGAPS